MQRLTFSARGYKGALTRSVSAANKLIDLFDAGPTSLGVTALLEASDDLDRQFLPLECRMQELMTNALDEKTYEIHERDLSHYKERYDKTKGEIYSAIKVAKLPPAPRITAPPVTPAVKPTAATPSTSTGTFAAAVTNPAVKPNLALKPVSYTHLTLPTTPYV